METRPVGLSGRLNTKINRMNGNAPPKRPQAKFPLDYFLFAVFLTTAIG